MPRASLSTEIPPEPARIVEVGHGFGGGVVTMRAPRTSARGPPPEHPRPARSLGDGSGGAGDDACSEERFTGHPHSLIMMKIRAGFSNGGKCRCFLAEVSLPHLCTAQPRAGQESCGRRQPSLASTTSTCCNRQRQPWLPAEALPKRPDMFPPAHAAPSRASATPGPPTRLPSCPKESDGES